LGIITAATLKLFPKPGYVQRALIGLDSAATAVSLLEPFRAGGRLAMFEVMPSIGYRAVIDNFDSVRDPFSEKFPWYLLCDWEVETEGEGLSIAENVIGKALDNNTVQDAVIAVNKTQAADILSIREHMSAGQKFLGGSIKHDITVPIDLIPEFFARADTAIQAVVPGCRPVGFGHFGDGNIHYNIAQPGGVDRETFLANWDALSQPVFDIVDALGGSISAEHGIGIMKRYDLAERASPVKMKLLRAVKQALDPHRIMNPRVMV